MARSSSPVCSPSAVAAAGAGTGGVRVAARSSARRSGAITTNPQVARWSVRVEDSSGVDPEESANTTTGKGRWSDPATDPGAATGVPMAASVNSGMERGARAGWAASAAGSHPLIRAT